MSRLFFEPPRSGVTMQTFAVVEGLVKMERQLRAGNVLHPKMMQSAHLGVEVTVHRVLRVAGEASMVTRHAIVLEVHSRNPTLVIDVQASAVRLHDMTGNAKRSLLRALHVFI